METCILRNYNHVMRGVTRHLVANYYASRVIAPIKSAVARPRCEVNVSRWMESVPPPTSFLLPLPPFLPLPSPSPRILSSHRLDNMPRDNTTGYRRARYRSCLPSRTFMRHILVIASFFFRILRKYRTILPLSVPYIRGDDYKRFSGPVARWNIKKERKKRDAREGRPCWPKFPDGRDEEIIFLTINPRSLSP